MRRSVKLTTNLRLVPRLKMRGLLPPLPCMLSWRNAQLSAETRLLLVVTVDCLETVMCVVGMEVSPGIRIF